MFKVNIIIYIFTRNANLVDFSTRKLCTYVFCRDRMLDSMCLLSICKQLFAEKVALRKEAMKAVLEWDIDSSDRSRSQVKLFN